ncbi:MAG: AraC family transcriptional regulator, partial [Pseudomonadota bacterium]
AFNAMIYEPVVCLVVQGGKEIIAGGQTVIATQGDAVIVSHDVPIVSRITGADAKMPYLAAIIPIDLELLRSIDGEIQAEGYDDASTSVVHSHIASPALVDAVGRYLHLEQSTIEGRVLAPVLLKEIHYHLLLAPNGGMLRQLLAPASIPSQINTAIGLIRESYSESLSIPELADRVNMSASAFYKNFKRVTGTSPLQFQKDLRLVDARNRLTSQARSVSEVCFEVGYESPAQFSREYARKFGTSPKHDLVRQ